MSQIMVRRSFMSCNMRNLLPPWTDPETIAAAEVEGPDVLMRRFFQFLVKNVDWKGRGYTGVVLALEMGSTGNYHIQGYLEHSQKRFSTLGKDLHMQASALEVVIDSTGSYNYCSGKGVHASKEGVLARWEFGEFKLHGDTHKADLKMLVRLVMDGVTPKEIFRNFPYAWCVHRDRLLKFYEDKAVYGHKTPRKGPAAVGFSDKKEGGQ